MHNAKNQLLEIVKELGYLEDSVTFQTDFNATESIFYSNALLSLNNKLHIEAIGTGSKKKAAEINASQHLIILMKEQYPDLMIDWAQIRIAAQAGDGLIKLCAYLTETIPSAAEKSFWLQKIETDKHMVEIFEQLKIQQHPDVIFFGDNLGAKRKATWIEALIWEKFGQAIIAPSAKTGFKELVQFLA